MTAVRIDLETKELSAFLNAAPRQTSIALLRSLKRGTKAAQTHAARVVSKDMGLKVGTVRKRIRIKQPTGQTLTGEVRADLKRIPLVNFGARATRRGVSYRGEGGRRRIPSAFLATMATGHRGVFKRAGSRRLPIRELFGPSIGHVFDHHRDEIMARGEQVVMAELDRQLKRIFGVSGG